MTLVRIFHKKNPNFIFFQISNGPENVQKLLTRKILFPKSANVHIFELLKRRCLRLNLKAKYENSLGGGKKAFRPYFHKSDYPY